MDGAALDVRLLAASHSLPLSLAHLSIVAGRYFHIAGSAGQIAGKDLSRTTLAKWTVLYLTWENHAMQRRDYFE